MAVTYNFKKGIDLPPWEWLPPAPQFSYTGTSSTYDGTRYLYWMIQYGLAAGASTTSLYRYDTWTGGWQLLVAGVASSSGMDIEYDSIRNVIYCTNGGSTTTWQVFNLNTISVTIANVSCPAWALTVMTPVLPILGLAGGSLTFPNDDKVPAVIDTGTADSVSNTTTQIKVTDATGTFGQGMIGLQVRITSGAQSGSSRTIVTVTDKNTLTVAALGGALAAGDTLTIELVSRTATSGSTTTVTDTASSWITNQYANSDVVITAGTGIGQRRRIASNTSTVLTLTAAVTGNARTGVFTTAPDSTSVFQIVPSSDFLYYQPGNLNATIYRIDVVQTTGAAWTASLGSAPAGIGGGGNTMYPSAYAPYSIVALAGNATKNFYYFSIGTGVWSTLTTFAGVETFTLGAASAMVGGKRKLLVQKEGTTRLYFLDLLTGIYEPGPTVPYAVPVAYEGKRARVITSADGAQFLYLLRAGGQEFFRVPLEWM